MNTEEKKDLCTEKFKEIAEIYEYLVKLFKLHYYCEDDKLESKFYERLLEQLNIASNKTKDFINESDNYDKELYQTLINNIHEIDGLMNSCLTIAKVMHKKRIDDIK